ncbi:MAG TPA: endonuclease domain-containing protein [Panacibacter sp.]|nr:endonuclease domain-containing protein [Panacibacter sp.]
MFAGANLLLFGLAKGLRKNMTDAEKLLWQYLKVGVSGLKFRRQHPLEIYIADFYCHKIKLVIELDGSVHNLSDIKEKDLVRQKDLEDWGFNIIRFSNKKVMHELENVLIEINDMVKNLIQNTINNKQ